VVSEEARILFALPGSLAQKDEGPVDHHVLGHLPFDPNSLEGGPCVLSQWALQEAMLGGLFRIGIAHLTLWGDAHELKPSAHWETLV
jgi:hypothetical protein